LVAGDGFGLLFGLVGRGVTVAIGRSDIHRLIGVGEVGRDGLGDVGERADLNDGRLGLLENELFVDGAHFGLFFEGLLTARAIFFGSGQGHIVLEVANASGVIGVNDQRVFEGFEIDVLALGVDFVFAVILVPLRDGRVLVHVFDDLTPSHTSVVSA